MFNNLANKTLLFSIDLSRRISMFLMQGGRGGITGTASDKINGSNATLAVVAFFIFTSFIIGMALGRSRLMISMASLYIAYFLENIFPYQKEVASYFPSYNIYLIRIALFLIFYILVLLFLSKSVLRSRLTLAETPFFTMFFLSLIKAGFIISILSTYIPTETVRLYSSLIIDYFATPKAKFLWALLPVISFAFIGRKKRETGDE